MHGSYILRNCGGGGKGGKKAFKRGYVWHMGPNHVWHLAENTADPAFTPLKSLQTDASSCHTYHVLSVCRIGNVRVPAGCKHRAHVSKLTDGMWAMRDRGWDVTFFTLLMLATLLGLKPIIMGVCLIFRVTVRLCHTWACFKGLNLCPGTIELSSC